MSGNLFCDFAGRTEQQLAAFDVQYNCAGGRLFNQRRESICAAYKLKIILMTGGMNTRVHRNSCSLFHGVENSSNIYKNFRKWSRVAIVFDGGALICNNEAVKRRN